VSPRNQRAVFIAAAAGIWLVFVAQALLSPVLLDDWFQLRYWRDHDFTVTAIWELGRHNYFHYNPRIGDVLLAIIDGSRLVHVIVSPIVQVAALVTTFVIAFGRWPRRTLGDLQLLLFVQVMIWLVIPIPGIIYFYRPIATNYLWAFTITMSLFVPFRLRAKSEWLAPIMLVLGWVAGMCNEHTGPAAMVAIAAFVYAAHRRRELRAWMITGLIGLYIGYPMLFFAPGQSARYSGLATRATPTKLLSERGITGCLAIVLDFLWESRLGLLLFAAAAARYALVAKRLPAASHRTAAILGAASIAIVVTLFVSPTTTDRVFYASGVLLVAALAIYAEPMFEERAVRRLVVAACGLLFAFHVVRFFETYIAVKAENDERIAILASTPRGTVAQLPPYEHAQRTRWHLGDDFVIYPWLEEYVASELFDLGDVARPSVTRVFDPPIDPEAAPPLPFAPTYRELQTDPIARARVAAEAGGIARLRVALVGLPFKRTVIEFDQTFVDGSPYDDEPRGHFIRVRPETLPPHVDSMYIAGCHETHRVVPIVDPAGVLLPVDESICRGIFTAIACDPERCWLAGWY
jgi:hypothetical protein